MKRGLGHILGCGLLLVVAWGFAQDGLEGGLTNDPVLQSFDLAVGRLNEAVNVLPTGGSASLNALDQAAQTLRTLSRDASSPNLVAALEGTFSRAETAVQNGSATDLGVQVAVLRGGIWRLVYESALRAANEGDLAASRERLVRIAADMAFGDADMDALSGADTFPALITAFDTGAAATVQTRLDAASTALGDPAASDAIFDRDAAYLALAGAYAHFLPVQDSPRLSATTAASFSQTFQALVAAEPVALQSSLTALRQSLSDFQAAAAASQSQALQQPVPQSDDAAQMPVADPASSLATPSPDIPTEARAAGNAAAVEDAPNGAAGVAVAETTVVEATVVEATVAEATVAEVIEAEVVEAVLPDAPTPVPALPLLDTVPTDLAAALAAFDLDDVSRADLVNAYLANGYSSVDDAVEALYADSSRTLSAIQRGDAGFVQARLDTYQDTFERFLAPLLGPDAAVSADTRQLVDRFATAPGLRLQDGAVLVGQTDRVAAAVTGSAATGTATGPGVLLSTSLLWAGWPRLLVMMMLGLLAVVPLYLLNLAFGGANRNWRLVGAALFLLLLPIMYEGLASLFELVANLSGVAVLGSLSTFSIFQNTLSQVVWAALSTLAIGLAVAGLYGICVQFGLLGRGAGDAVVSSGDTALGRASTGTAIDWDEEF